MVTGLILVSLMRTLALCSLVRGSHSFVPQPRLAYYWSAAALSTLRPAFGNNSPIANPDLKSDSTQSCPSRSTKSQTCHRMTSSSSTPTVMTGYLNAADAAALDVELMTEPGFSLEQLMELAGLSVAEAVYQVVEESRPSNNQKPKILVVCGPGNNGGDGLVAARHLVMFGYECEIVYPKQSKKQHFINLVQQCEDVGILIGTEMPQDCASYDAIVDAIFGFSFHGAPREPFATILQQIKKASSSSSSTVAISVDVPSGWNVDEGDVAKTGFTPDVLISLTTPKHCSKSFSGRHFLGGRFLPPKLAEKYGVQMPPYPGVSQVMEVTSTGVL